MVTPAVGIHPNSWAGKSYVEIAELARQDGSLLVVPVGSIEQHGFHLPVGTDTILADAMAQATAERIDEDVPVLVTPPIWTGFSPHHLAFGGTISIEFEHLLHVLEDTVATATKNGFDGVLLLNGHGGNGPLISSAVSTIGQKYPDVEINGVTYFELATSFIGELRDSDIGGMAHGGEFETSLMLHLCPDLVRVEEIEGTPLDEPYSQGTQDLVVSGPLSTYRSFEFFSDSGAIGDPTAASAEKGEAILELLTDELEALAREIYSANT